MLRLIRATTISLSVSAATLLGCAEPNRYEPPDGDAAVAELTDAVRRADAEVDFAVVMDGATETNAAELPGVEATDAPGAVADAGGGSPADAPDVTSFCETGPARRCWPDQDGDGFGKSSSSPAEMCAATCPTGTAENADDCDDSDNGANPAASFRGCSTIVGCTIVQLTEATVLCR